MRRRLSAFSIGALILIVACIAFSETCSAHSDSCSICDRAVRDIERNMKKTAKKNHGGGNTHWEEKSLSSWTTSELRLVEVLEDICVDKSDFKCRKMIEDNEDEIEDWFFNRQSENLRDVLCINSAKACCKDGYFGNSCKPCPGGADRPCNGHGSCQGSGRRDGAGTCSCHANYEGDVCNACKKGFFKKLNGDDPDKNFRCNPCSFKCRTCTGPDASDCTQCATSFFNNTESGECERCDSTCLECTGSGPSDCLSCIEGFRKDPINCVDIDECETPNRCPETQICINVPGSFNCECPVGYRKVGTQCTEEPDTSTDESESSSTETIEGEVKQSEHEDF